MLGLSYDRISPIYLQFCWVLCYIFRSLGPIFLYFWTPKVLDTLKLACWKVFSRADEDVITALANLGTREHPDGDTIKGVEKFVCNLYQPNTSICQVNELRWSLFKKKQAQSERLPPTPGALREAIVRAHYQTMVWNNDKVPNPNIPSP